MRTRTDADTALPPVFMRLTEIGRVVADDREGVGEVIQSAVGDELINRSMSRPYFEKAKRLPTEDLILLIRGLVTAESHLHWLGGSAATGIRLFRILDERDPERADLVGDWILQHNYNPYLPCGWVREGTSTMAQYRQIPARREARHRWHEEDCRQRHEQALRRHQARRAEGEKRVQVQKAASAERLVLLDRLALLSINERLAHVVLDLSHAPQYYPEYYALVSIEQIRAMTPGFRRRLMVRLKIIRRGTWRRLYQTLQESEFRD